MSNRMLEEALSTSPICSMRPGCSSCDKRYLCNRVSGIMGDIAKIQMNVWDLEYKIRFKSLITELNSLGFEFPDSIRYCEMSEMTHKEATQILREAQELLIEMKSHNENETELKASSV
ncbi:MAG: hypothetical protein NTX25_04675 [Proteobacteria bacterium]|nr:hypothetical protein [Pseudomonadota bacterium]